MAPSTRFPNLREFRARVALLGQETRSGEPLAAPPPREPPPAVPWLWVGLAAAAVATLAWVAVTALVATPGDALGGPEAVAVVPAANPATPRVVVQERTDARRLETRLAHIEEDLDALRRDSVRSGRVTTGLEQRLDLIEQAFGPITGSIDTGPPPAPPDISPAPRVEAPRPTPDSAPVATRAPTPLFNASGDGRRNAMSDPAGDETPPRFVPEIAYAVDLGGFGDLGALKRYWSQLVNENPLLLGGLVPRQVTKVEADGMRSFRLIAGPLDDVGASARLCNALRIRQIECSRTIDGGETI